VVHHPLLVDRPALHSIIHNIIIESRFHRQSTMTRLIQHSTLPAALRGPAVATRRNNRPTSRSLQVSAMSGTGRFFVGGTNMPSFSWFCPVPYHYPQYVWQSRFFWIRYSLSEYSDSARDTSNVHVDTQHQCIYNEF
jgi:hypothetical protein